MTIKPIICVFNLGCKVNQYDSDAMLAKFKEAGYEVVDDMQYADVYVLNTCAVTNEAEHKSRQAVTRARKCNPNARIYVCGCSSQNNAAPYVALDVNGVFGTAGKTTSLIDRVLKDLTDADSSKFGCYVQEDNAIPKTYEDEYGATSLRTRHYVKVQDGCNNFCSYCLIPYVRGRSRSQDLQRVVNECLSAQNYTGEIVLTGINLSAYGKDIGLSLATLIEALSGVDARLRLGSLEVNVIDDAFLQATQKLKAFCPHFHLSLQSGDDKVLKDMNRHYTTADYFAAVEKIRAYYPNAAITTDLIVGFPTESEENFANSMAFARKVQFADMHVFPYSRRDGTAACKYQPLCGDILDERQKRMNDLKHVLRNTYLKAQIGKQLEVLFETKEDDMWCGHTENYVKVFCQFGVRGQRVLVTPQELYSDGVFAKYSVVDEPEK